jgi:hypothetical protein
MGEADIRYPAGYRDGCHNCGRSGADCNRGDKEPARSCLPGHKNWVSSADVSRENDGAEMRI